MPYKDPAKRREVVRASMAKARADKKPYAVKDYHSDQRKLESATKVRNKPKFVAIDGEGTNQPDGDQWYTLMVGATIDGCLDSHCDQRVSRIERYSGGGLGTEQCLRWLLDLGYWRSQVYVSFFFNYDINKMLHDLKSEEILALWHANWVVWQGEKAAYYIKWIPSKFLEVAEYHGSPDRPFNRRKDLGRSITIYDTSGFFQSSFVKALQDWGILSNEEVEQIAEMKGKRNDFQADDRRQIYQYCKSECLALCEMMNKLADALWDAELYLTEWHGAGAIAKKLFRKYGVKEHLETPPPEVEEAILGAYFGGRIEVFRQGYFPEGVYDYDLQSAYPSAAISLPSLKGAVWTHQSYQNGKGLSLARIPREELSCAEALWLLSWDVTEKLSGSQSKRRLNTLVGPLPFRQSGRISFPFQAGPTWVHADEAKMAVAIYGAENFTLHERWWFAPTNPDLPFGFLQQVAAERIAAKKAGQAKHKPLKLGMNSVYGKLAQGQHDPDHVPEYLSYYYAGRITARTRAKILDCAVRAGPGLVAVATDGVFTTTPIEGLEFGSLPGSWEEAGDASEAVLILQPGIMFSESGQIKKTRGFSRSSLTYFDTTEEKTDVRLSDGRLLDGVTGLVVQRKHPRTVTVPKPGLKAVWLDKGPTGLVFYVERRFVGVGGSLAAGRPESFGRWLDVQRRISFYIGETKRYLNGRDGFGYERARDFTIGDEYDEFREHVYCVIPYDYPGVASQPYVKPHLLDESASEELRQFIAGGDDEYDAFMEQPDWMDYFVGAGDAGAM